MTPTDDGDPRSLARPKVTFDHTGSAADAVEPLRWRWLPGALFGAAALAALVAAIALVVTWPAHEVSTVPINAPGTSASQAATPPEIRTDAPQLAPPIEKVVQQTLVSAPAPRAPGDRVPPIQSPAPATVTRVVTTPVVTTPVIAPVTDPVTTPVVTSQRNEGGCTPPECITVTECTPSNCVVDPAGVGPAPGGGGATRNSGGDGRSDSGGSAEDDWLNNCPANLPPGMMC